MKADIALQVSPLKCVLAMRSGLRLFLLMLGVLWLLSATAFASSRHRQDDTPIKLSLAPGDTYIPVNGDPVTNNQDGSQYMEFTAADGDKVQSGSGIVRSVLLMNDGQDVEVMPNTKFTIHGRALKLSAGAVDVQNCTNGPVMGPYDFTSFESPAQPANVNVNVQIDGSDVRVLGGHAVVAAEGSSPVLSLRSGSYSLNGGLDQGWSRGTNWAVPSSPHGVFTLGGSRSSGRRSHHHMRRARHHRHRHHRMRAHRHATGGVTIHHGRSVSSRIPEPSVSISVRPSDQVRITNPSH